MNVAYHLMLARGSFRWYWLKRGLPPWMRCTLCKRRRWAEEVICGHGWCDDCWERKMGRDAELDSGSPDG